MSKVTPCLWFADRGEEAAKFYVSVVPNSTIERVTPLPADSPSGPAGSVLVIDFNLGGTPFQILQAGPLDPFNHAVSFVIACKDQAEVDKVWYGLLEGGGKESQCGWLRDRYGVAWQIVPTRMIELMANTDRAKAKRVAEAMLKMVKLDIAALEKAAAGT